MKGARPFVIVLVGGERVQEEERERRRRFEALFEAYSADVVAYCGWRASSASDAQDAVAEVFLTAWRRLDDVPQRDAARVWLYATARRVLANQRRSTLRRAALVERVALAAPPTEQPNDPEDSLVREALRRLRPLDREILLLSEWEGLSPAQIASVLRCPKVTARGRLHRARRRFRSAFEQLATTHDSARRVHPVSGLPAASVTHMFEGGS
jgi:RNA polymerase sigma factor (sigma-70 family)